MADNGSASRPAPRITAATFRRMKSRGDRITMLTAYDYRSAQLFDAAGVDGLLVGDSLGMVVLGYESTLSVTVDDMVHHAAAVNRAKVAALVVGDMPWLSYHTGPADAVRNAGRLIAEGGCQAVKIEGGRKRIPVVEAILDAEIPVMGHLGLTPQSLHAMGGYKVQGRDPEVAAGILEDAVALADAGCFCIVLEGVPSTLAREITEAVAVPTIGIGAGPWCDGQVLVFHDLLGLEDRIMATFVRRYASLKADAVAAVTEFAADVRARRFPTEAESYGGDHSGAIGSGPTGGRRGGSKTA